jgi:hypothetical protein
LSLPRGNGKPFIASKEEGLLKQYATDFLVIMLRGFNAARAFDTLSHLVNIRSPVFREEGLPSQGDREFWQIREEATSNNIVIRTVKLEE